MQTNLHIKIPTVCIVCCEHIETKCLTSVNKDKVLHQNTHWTMYTLPVVTPYTSHVRMCPNTCDSVCLRFPCVTCAITSNDKSWLTSRLIIIESIKLMQILLSLWRNWMNHDRLNLVQLVVFFSVCPINSGLPGHARGVRGNNQRFGLGAIRIG